MLFFELENTLIAGCLSTKKYAFSIDFKAENDQIIKVLYFFLLFLILIINKIVIL